MIDEATRLRAWEALIEQLPFDGARNRLAWRAAQTWKLAYYAEYSLLTNIFQPTADERALVEAALAQLLATMPPTPWTDAEISGWQADMDLGAGAGGHCDLIAALGNNHTGITAAPKQILLEITGENDGKDWHWIVRLVDGRFAYIHGGCDYTGWDCQSNCDVHEADTLDACLRLVGEVEKPIFEEMIATRQARRSA